MRLRSLSCVIAARQISNKLTFQQSNFLTEDSDMGATDFYTSAHGANVDEAFGAAVREAHYAHGHSGYTGSIAEKDDYVVVDVDDSPLTLGTAIEIARKLLDDDDPRVSSKWGPAGVIALDDGTWLFFGFAST